MTKPGKSSPEQATITPLYSDRDRIQTPLGQARGAGAAHAGTGHWLHQRLTAVSNLGLMAWLAWAAAHMPSWSYQSFTGWLSAPVNAILTLLAVVSVCYHAALGTQVIVEDYVHHEAFRAVGLTGLRLAFAGLAVSCIFCILKIAFG